MELSMVGGILGFSIILVFIILFIERFASRIPDRIVGVVLILIGLGISTEGGIYEYMASGFFSVGFLIFMAPFQRESENKIVSKLDEINNTLGELHSNIEVIEEEIYALNRETLKSLEKDVDRGDNFSLFPFYHPRKHIFVLRNDDLQQQDCSLY
ncbi:hypothetical protein E3E38_08895 [Thermococcus sp. 18S1]|uniref:hypothetical protein n=1 Tax=Thermococcus sp. 18S1 TaxID=1638210 RepID=UPI00143B75A2|nr:hypothetical protein [Thermococcus sp. 18S1]NJE31158.1 hypothetical protein [Thermococcus sp. 18S1]